MPNRARIVQIELEATLIGNRVARGDAGPTQGVTPRVADARVGAIDVAVYTVQLEVPLERPPSDGTHPVGRDDLELRRSDAERFRTA